MIAVHTADSSSARVQPAQNADGWERELTAFWALLAPVLKATQPDLLAVELLNEPNGMKDPAEWPAAQDRIRTAVRTVLPRHTIVLTGEDWGGIDGLIRLTPSSDANVVYSFHFYEPHAFTHQQATWGSPTWREIKGLQYPFEQSNTDAALATTADSKALAMLRKFAKGRWDAAVIRTRIDAAKNWATEHHATLYLGEFGAYRAGCDEKSRNAWLKDVRTAAEGAGIGWCVWDFAGGYAVSDRPSGKGKRTLDQSAAQALGLSPPATPRK